MCVPVCRGRGGYLADLTELFKTERASSIVRGPNNRSDIQGEGKSWWHKTQLHLLYHIPATCCHPKPPPPKKRFNMTTNMPFHCKEVLFVHFHFSC